MLSNFSYIRPKTLKEASKQLAAEGARLYAGGTDLLGCLRDHVFEINKMVSISGLKELKGINKTADGGIRIGALTTISEVAENPLVNSQYRALAQAAREVASPQLRNQGTIGGNICQKPRCWYYRGDFHCLRKGGEKCFAVAGENQYHCILGGGPCFIVHPSDTAPALVAFQCLCPYRRAKRKPDSSSREVPRPSERGRAPGDRARTRRDRHRDLAPAGAGCEKLVSQGKSTRVLGFCARRDRARYQV